MKIFKLVTLLLITAVLFSACKKSSKEKTEKKADQPTITLQKLENSPAYAEASLLMKTPKSTKISNGAAVAFDFSVNNYELKAQTSSTNAQILANSGKGQHIHFILNNQPYSAHYDPSFSKELPNGVHHLVAFLSRSYHESVKNKKSVVVKKLEVGKNPEDTQGLDINAPTLIYSRPKGTYVGKDTQSLLLDFFVLNTTLSENGNKVKATINGTEFIITEWAPHVVKGLSYGTVTIQLELIDSEGKLIPGPFNNVTRTVTLAEKI